MAIDAFGRGMTFMEERSSLQWVELSPGVAISGFEIVGVVPSARMRTVAISQFPRANRPRK